MDTEGQLCNTVVIHECTTHPHPHISAHVYMTHTYEPAHAGVFVKNAQAFKQAPCYSKSKLTGHLPFLASPSILQRCLGGSGPFFVLTLTDKSPHSWEHFSQLLRKPQKNLHHAARNEGSPPCAGVSTS